MQRRHLLLGIALLFIVASSFVPIIASTPAFAHVAHSSIYISPTPAPDANATLQMAQQEENNIQTILSIINILIVVYPILITVAALVLGFFGLRDLNTLKKQREDLLEDIKKIQGEATEAETAIVRTQQAVVYFTLGDRFANQSDMRKAIEAYKKVGDLLPNNPQINYLLGTIYSGLGYYEEAIRSLEAALNAEQQYPEAEMELGLAYRRRGDHKKDFGAQVGRNHDYEKAIEHLLRAIELRPNYDDALSTLGGLYRRKGEHETALEYYEAAYRANPISSYALGNVASLLWYLGMLDKARQYYILTELVATNHSTTTNVKVYWDYYDLALAQLALGKTDDAKKSYATAIGATPREIQIDSVLDVLYLLQKAQDPIPGLDEVIQMLVREQSIRASQ